MAVNVFELQPYLAEVCFSNKPFAIQPAFPYACCKLPTCTSGHRYDEILMVGKIIDGTTLMSAEKLS